MSRAVVAGLKALTELSVFLHKLAGPIDHLIGARYGDPLRPGDSGNVVSVDEDGHVLLWRAHSWIDDGDMGERNAPRLCVNHPRKP